MKKIKLPALFIEIIDHDNKHEGMLRESVVSFTDYKISKKRRHELTNAAEKYVKSSRNPEGRMQ